MLVYQCKRLCALCDLIAEAVKALLELGAKVNCQEPDDQTAGVSRRRAWILRSISSPRHPLILCVFIMFVVIIVISINIIVIVINVIIIVIIVIIIVIAQRYFASAFEEVVFGWELQDR